MEDPRLREEARHILNIQLEDNVKAHILQPDGSYEKIDKRGKTLICAQDYFCQEAVQRAKAPKEEGQGRIFVPAQRRMRSDKEERPCFGIIQKSFTSATG